MIANLYRLGPLHFLPYFANPSMLYLKILEGGRHLGWLLDLLCIQLKLYEGRNQ